MAMRTRQHSRASVGLLVLVGCAGMALQGCAGDSGARAQAGQPQIPGEPLRLPNHRYDLPATLVTAAQLEAHKARMLADQDEDVPVNMVKAGGGSDRHQVGISLVYRLKGQSNPNFAVHDDVAEVYHVLEGKGTMLLGGTIVDWQRRPTSAGNGMGSGGTKSEGAREIQIARGDVLIFPCEPPTSSLRTRWFAWIPTASRPC